MIDKVIRQSTENGTETFTLDEIRKLTISERVDSF